MCMKWRIITVGKDGHLPTVLGLHFILFYFFILVVFICINKNDYIELQNDVKNMKNDIKQIKNTLGELVEMMKAVYEFEDN